MRRERTKYQKYLKCMVICHGKSEYTIARHINSNIRLLSLEIIAKNKGKSSIQIKGLLDFINSLFETKDEFMVKYGDRLQGEKLSNDFKIFTIMDTDDKELTSNDIKKYKNREMFKGHWAYKYITPIYNIKNLEEVLLKIGVINKLTKKNEYLRIFPINKNSSETDVKQIEEMAKKLSQINNTNMDEMLRHFIIIAQTHR